MIPNMIWIKGMSHEFWYIKLAKYGEKWWVCSTSIHNANLISRDDHQFSPLHWAAKGGHTKIVEMLMSRGARVHTTNMGDDTPLHLAAAFGNRDIVLMVKW